MRSAIQRLRLRPGDSGIAEFQELGILDVVGVQLLSDIGGLLPRASSKNFAASGACAKPRGPEGREEQEGEEADQGRRA